MLTTNLPNLGIYFNLIITQLGWVREIDEYSLYCSTPRKSLVKGERFIRSEVEPELIKFK